MKVQNNDIIAGGLTMTYIDKVLSSGLQDNIAYGIHDAIRELDAAGQTSEGERTLSILRRISQEVYLESKMVMESKEVSIEDKHTMLGFLAGISLAIDELSELEYG